MSTDVQIGDVVWAGPSTKKRRLAVVLDPSAFRDAYRLWVRFFDGHSLEKPKKILDADILSHADEAVAADVKAALQSPKLGTRERRSEPLVPAR